MRNNFNNSNYNNSNNGISEYKKNIYGRRGNYLVIRSTIGIIILIIGIILLLNGCGAIKNTGFIDTTDKKANTYSQRENEQQNQLEYDIEDSLTNIADEYYLNEARANVKYFGKKIKITAGIEDITVDSSVFFNLGVTVYLREKGARYDLICNFGDGDSSGITYYNKGDKITIVGTMDEMIGSSLYMKKCNIID